MKNLTSSVDKTFAILDHFTIQNPAWSVTELSKVMGSNKSTVYRFLSDLEKLGAMYQDAETGKYSLGLKLFELGKKVRLQSAFVDKTHPELIKVAENITETVHIALLDQKQVYYIDKVKSPQGLTIDTEIGSRKPLHATSLGKVLLAHTCENEAQLEEFLPKGSLIPCTPNTHTDLASLSGELNDIRKHGYAVDREEYEIGLICVAVPIFNQDNGLVASMSAAGPANRFKEEELMNYVRMLQSGAQAIREKIGTFQL